ncbi:MAG: ATP synthase F1 subunit gamma [Candidatus Pacebacteria bacterium]|nr:ATP synthase F1 subunit gamma [Candidatus Paceibacterota bacterium]
MANLKLIKSKIISYKKTGTVTHAMEAVSAVKMRKAQERALSGRSYAAAALTILERVSGTADMSRHPLMDNSIQGLPLEKKDIVSPSGGKKVAFIVVTSDKGLAGSVNSAVIRKVENEIVARGLSKDDVVMACIGRRGGDYFYNRGYDVRIRQLNRSDDVTETEMREVTDQVLAWHESGEIGTAVIAYQNFLSTFEQQPSVRQIIPITTEGMRETVAGIRPARGKYAPSGEPSLAPASYTIEPDADSVLSVLLPKLLNIAVYHGLLESKASEHSARMVAMKSATDKAKDMAHSLTRTFNKVRQAAITREVSEITSGMEAMR